MKNLIILLSALLMFFGCDRMKTTKQLCQMSDKDQLIQERISRLQDSNLNKEIKTALKNKDSAFIKCMLKHGYARYDEMFVEKDNELIIAIISSGWDVAEIEPLLTEISVADLRSLLMFACSRGNLELTKLLLNKGASINYLSAEGRTPLSSAVSSGNLELVKFLIESGAGKKLGSPLSAALNLQDKEKASQIANYLLDVGVKYSFEDLLLASKLGIENVVDRLLELGVSPVSDWNTYTPLMAACEGGHIDVIKRLLKTDAGKRYYTRRSCGNGYQNFSMGLDQSRIVDHPGSPLYLTNALLYAVWAGNIEATKLLLKAGANPNYDTFSICEEDRKDYQQNAYYSNYGCIITPLIVASYNGNKEIIKLLIEYGADINYQCKEYPSLHTQIVYKYKHPKKADPITRTAISVAKDDETQNLLAQLGASN